MTIEERILKAQNDNDYENEVIKEYIPFILSCSNKVLGKFINREDDEFSIAILAFHEAVQKYGHERGAFLSFARLVIKNRLTDYLRSEYRQKNIVPFSSLSATDEDGNILEFDVEVSDISQENYARYEIEELSYELKQFGISFFDVSKNSPKMGKTKKNCTEVIKYIISNEEMIKSFKEKKYIPVKQITEELSVNKKIIERHRNYIIAVVLVMTGDYEIIQGYFPMLKGGGLI